MEIILIYQSIPCFFFHFYNEYNFFFISQNLIILLENQIVCQVVGIFKLMCDKPDNLLFTRFSNLSPILSLFMFTISFTCYLSYLKIFYYTVYYLSYSFVQCKLLQFSTRFEDLYYENWNLMPRERPGQSLRTRPRFYRWRPMLSTNRPARLE